MKVEATIHSGNVGRRKTIRKPKPPVVGRTPRIAKLIALAIRLDRLTGQVADQADLARVCHVSRAGLTQIMTMLQLAPHIQESLLFLPKSNRRDKITERELRALSRSLDCNTQRKNWVAYSVDSASKGTQAFIARGLDNVR